MNSSKIERKFREENEMIPIIVSYLNMRGFSVEEQVQSRSLGKPDVVGYILNEKKVKTRLQQLQRIPLDSLAYQKVLDALPCSSTVRFDELLTKVNISESYLKGRILKRLEEAGYLRLEDQDIIKVNGFIDFCKKIVTIEAKLEDWKRAFFQARRNQFISDYCYIAISEDFESRVERSVLKEYGVGLLIVGPRGVTESIRAKKSNNLDTALKNLFVEEIWRRIADMKFEEFDGTDH